FALLWLLIVACFAAFGFLQADERFPSPYMLEPIVGFGAVGIAAASCAMVGLLVISKVRARRLPRSLAVVLLLGASALSIIIPIPIIQGAMSATPYRGSEDHGIHLFQGEHGW